MKVIVEGNIGAGKSSFIDFLSTHKQFKTFKEPIEKWQNFNGYNLLDLMYGNTAKYGLAFQLYASITNMEMDQIIDILHQTSETIVVRERCFDSIRACFGEAMMNCGVIDRPIFDVLMKWYDFLKTMNYGIFDFDVVVYIKTSPETARDRIQKRQRDEEKTIDEYYLELLHDLYEKWIDSIDTSKTIVVTIDGNLNENEIEKEYRMVMNLLLAHQKLEQ